MGTKWVAAILLQGALGIALAQNPHLKHFTHVGKYVYAGAKPDRDSDFAFLRSIGVKYILQLDFLPGLNERERKRAAKYGMTYFSVPLNGSFDPPSESHVNRALRIMRTHQPIYLHCVKGRDRTGLLVGLYMMYFEGVSKEHAYRLMKKEGFRDVFYLRGLKVYFDKHTRVPRELADLKTR